MNKKGYTKVGDDDDIDENSIPLQPNITRYRDADNDETYSGERTSIGRDREGENLNGEYERRRSGSIASTSSQEGLMTTRATHQRIPKSAKVWALWPPTKCCVFIWALMIGGMLILIAAGGGVYVYKKEPESGQSPPWYPSPRGGTSELWERSYQSAKKMVSQMSLVEKVNITTGTGWMMGPCVGNTGPALSVGFPSLCFQDGPLGIRFVENITAFPAGITIGATWNRDLMNKRGKAMGVEARLKGVNVLMAPVMGPLGRMPAGGRNWEGFGADPVLQAAGSADTIRGIQSEGVMATAKHFVGNEQEHFRQSYEWGLPNAMSTNIDDRTLHELYLWPFADSVRVGVASVMCSYQMINNSYACQNSKLLNGILKDELGFQGFVVSDWLAQRSGVASALAGLDMTMPGDGLRWADGKGLFGEHLTRAVLNGSVPMERINDMATRIVAAWYQTGQNYWEMPPPDGDGGPNFSSWTTEEIGLLYPGSDDKIVGVVNKFVDAQGEGQEAHKILARKIAAEGTVLLKNEGGILPLSRNGPASGHRTEGGIYRIGIFGEDAGSGKGPNACPDRGCNQGTLAQGWGSGAVEFPYLISPWDALQGAFEPSQVSLSSHLDNKVPPEKLKDIDICIAFANSDGGEGFIASGGIEGDRNDLFLQKDGDEFVKQVATNCGDGMGDTIVIVHAVGPVIVERWIDLPGVKAVLFAHLPGQESGNAIVDVLLGAVDASGRLPYTVGKKLEDYGTGGQVLYYPNAPIPQQDFEEGLYIDYRHFDKYDITPRYSFGYGLSYTTFEFSNLVVTPMQSKLPLPEAPAEGARPPIYSNEIPDASTTIFPFGFRKLRKYIYSYINQVTSDITSPSLPPEYYYNTPSLSTNNTNPGGNTHLYENVARVNIDITNTGSRTGSAVAQLYLSFPENPTYDPVTGKVVTFPKRVLRNFRKLQLIPGEKQTITMYLNRRDLSYWSVGAQDWIMPMEGHFRIIVSKSIAEIGEALEGWF